MGKRSNYERIPRDFYPTPYEAVIPLLPFVQGTFCEPCAGDGALIRHLEVNGLLCNAAYDIEPQECSIIKGNAFDLSVVGANQIITNPPWGRDILHPMISHFRNLAPTWLLFDADWMHTVQSAPYMPYCAKIVSVGRVQWIPDSESTGMDNCCWYLFVGHETETVFYGRNKKTDRCEDTMEMF